MPPALFLMHLQRLLAAAAAIIAAVSCGRTEEQRIVLGDERSDVYLPLLEGKRVALFSNQTGVVGDLVKGRETRPQLCTDETSLDPLLGPGDTSLGPHILDVLISEGVNVTAIFSPEHGFRGTADAGELVSSSVDEKTGVPILSLYEEGSHFPSDENMAKFDVLVVDIQDVGLRYYTYYVTMTHLMDACAMHGKSVVVLDRPNPNGFYVDGPILDTLNLRTGVGWLPIPTVHGMTLGELAQMINGEGWLEGGRKCDLEVVPCLGYTHETKYSLIQRPSPNLKDMKSIYLYSSTCYFEGTVVSGGRGTAFPFECFGHPALRGYNFSFIPESMPGATSPRYEGEVCYGRDLRGLPLDSIWAGKINLSYVIEAYAGLNREDPEGWEGEPSIPMGEKFFRKGHFDALAGQRYVREDIMVGKTAEEISGKWASDVEKFKALRRPYLLYPE